MGMKFYLILPPRQSRFGALFNIYSDLLKGFRENNVETEVIEIDLGNIKTGEFRQEFPITTMTVNEFVHWNEEGDKITLMVDDVPVITALRKGGFNFKKTIVWSHFFYGYRMISHNHIENARNLTASVQAGLSDFIPPIVWKHFVKEYVEILRSTNLAALSLYLCLLLNRTYNLQCKEVIYPPIHLDGLYNTMPKTHTNNVLIFLGGGSTAEWDTPINDTVLLINKLLKIYPDFNLHAFGPNIELLRAIESGSNRKIVYHKDIDRNTLAELMHQSEFTVASQIFGTFELVPVESLIVGTPVISYKQPFMEVTGHSLLIADPNSDNELRSKVSKWLSCDIEKEREDVKNKIRAAMDPKKIAEEFIQFADISLL